MTVLLRTFVISTMTLLVLGQVRAAERATALPDDLGLTATHELAPVGYQIRHPGDWRVTIDGPVSRIVEPAADGIQVVFDARDRAFMQELGLRPDATIDDLVTFNTAYFGITYAMVEQQSDATVFGAPSRRIRFVQANGVVFDAIMGFRGDLVFLLYASAPSAEAMSAFAETFAAMVESLEPASPRRDPGR
jgi:hypothetical protein